MTEREMFEKSFQRPSNYFKLSGERQWEIDKELGILDWMGDDLSKEDMVRFRAHYNIKERKKVIDEKLQNRFDDTPKKLTKSDKYLARLVWNRYKDLYKRSDKLKPGEYARRRKHYLNMIDEILGWNEIDEYEDRVSEPPQ